MPWKACGFTGIGRLTGLLSILFSVARSRWYTGDPKARAYTALTEGDDSVNASSSRRFCWPTTWANSVRSGWAIWPPAASAAPIRDTAP